MKGLLLAFLATIVTIVTGQDCPAYYVRSRDGRSCYRYFNIRVPYHMASEFCEMVTPCGNGAAKMGALASVGSAMENLEIYNLVASFSQDNQMEHEIWLGWNSQNPYFWEDGTPAFSRGFAAFSSGGFRPQQPGRPGMGQSSGWPVNPQNPFGPPPGQAPVMQRQQPGAQQGPQWNLIATTQLRAFVCEVAAGENLPPNYQPGMGQGGFGQGGQGGFGQPGFGQGGFGPGGQRPGFGQGGQRPGQRPGFGQGGQGGFQPGQGGQRPGQRPGFGQGGQGGFQPGQGGQRPGQRPGFGQGGQGGFQPGQGGQGGFQPGQGGFPGQQPGQGNFPRQQPGQGGQFPGQQPGQQPGQPGFPRQPGQGGQFPGQQPGNRPNVPGQGPRLLQEEPAKEQPAAVKEAPAEVKETPAEAAPAEEAAVNADAA